MPPKHSTVTISRQIAYSCLLGVLSGKNSDSELHQRLSPEIEPADAALATEITLGVLRWQRLLDFLIARGTGKGAAALDPEVLIALRMGLYQLRFLTRVPASAAVNESVKLVKQARKRSAASLVNAVLRRAPREPMVQLVPAVLPPAERLGILHSHPTWLVERWLARFGEAQTIALLESDNKAPQATCAILRPERRDEVLTELTANGIRVEAGRWMENALRISGGNVSQTNAYRNGWITIQDEASQMVARLLEVPAGAAVLDLCAAPGGKTAQLARAAGGSAPVLACDRSVSRLRAMRDTMQRLHLPGVQLVALDGEQPLPLARTFGRILVDAPCSGTGTLARNPEIRWRLRLEDLNHMHQRQVRLLRNAFERLAPGGRLVYSTCSLEPEENEDVVHQAFEASPHVVQIRAPRAIPAELSDTQGAFRTFPPRHGTDGFFAVSLERTEHSPAAAQTPPAVIL